MYSQFYMTRDAVRNRVNNDDFHGALGAIRDLVTAVMHEQLAPGELIGSQKLDELCEFVAESYLKRHDDLQLLLQRFHPHNKRVVVLCTGLYKYGGTSLVVGDLARAHSGWVATVILTNTFNDMSDSDLKSPRIGVKEADVKIAPRGRLDEKLEWIISLLCELSPDRIFLLNHHQDSVIITAGALLAKKTNVLFYHHADHNLCLGSHLKNTIHIDPHNVGFYNCREKELIRNNYYLPMTIDDKAKIRKPRTFIKNGRLTTCSSGTYHKFQNFYLYPYIELIVDRLKLRNGNHIHIGNIPKADLEMIGKKLEKESIDKKRFQHIPWVPSLTDAFVTADIDLFIGSFPIGGARTYIEAMCAGLPMLMHENYLSRFHSSRDIVYPNALLWKYPEEFRNAIETASLSSLEEQARWSREHFIKYYSNATIDIGQVLNEIVETSNAPSPPALYNYTPDYFDRILHFSHIQYVMVSAGIADGKQEAEKFFTENLISRITSELSSSSKLHVEGFSLLGLIKRRKRTNQAALKDVHLNEPQLDKVIGMSSNEPISPFLTARLQKLFSRLIKKIS